MTQDVSSSCPEDCGSEEAGGAAGLQVPPQLPESLRRLHPRLGAVPRTGSHAHSHTATQHKRRCTVSHLHPPLPSCTSAQLLLRVTSSLLRHFLLIASLPLHTPLPLPLHCIRSTSQLPFHHITASSLRHFLLILLLPLRITVGHFLLEPGSRSSPSG